MRRYVLIGVILAFLLIGVVVYFFFFDSSNRLFSEESNTNPPTSNPIDPTDPVLGPIEIVGKKILAPALSLDQASIWYFDETGQLYRNSLDGKQESLFSLSGNTPVEKVYWPPVGNDFIVFSKAAEGRGIFRTYRALGGGFIDLPSNILQLAWLADGKSIVYVWQRGDGKLELKTADPTATNYHTLFGIDYPYTLRVDPKGKYVYLVKRPDDSDTNKVWAVDLATEQVSEILDRGKNLDVLPSPDGAKLLFTRVSVEKSSPEVWIYDFGDNSYKNLNLPTALDKVVWAADSSKFYFGQPRSIPVNDPAVTAATSDELYVFALAGRIAQKVDTGSSALRLDVRNPVVNSAGTMLFFRDGGSGKLYRVNPK